MICLKGCSKEIEMLNELLSKAIKEKNDKAEALDLYMEAGARRIKELESKLLNFDDSDYNSRSSQKITSEQLSMLDREMGFESKEMVKILAKDTATQLMKSDGYKLADCPKIFNDELHKSTSFRTHYNEPVTGQTLFSPDFVGEVSSPTLNVEASLTKYPAKKKK